MLGVLPSLIEEGAREVVDLRAGSRTHRSLPPLSRGEEPEGKKGSKAVIEAELEWQNAVVRVSLTSRQDACDTQPDLPSASTKATLEAAATAGAPKATAKATHPTHRHSTAVHGHVSGQGTEPG